MHRGPGPPGPFPIFNSMQIFVYYHPGYRHRERVMNWEHLLSQYGLLAATLIVCFIGGLIPVVLNTEAFLLAVSAFSTPPTLVLVVLLSAAIHTGAKTLIYLTGRGVLHIPLKKYEHKLESVRERLERWKSSPMFFILLSAATGMPPFYIVSILAGMLKYSYPAYAVCGFIGLLIRFALIVTVPQVIKGLL